MYNVEGLAITLTSGDTFYATIVIRKKSDNTIYTPVEGDVVTFYLKKDTSSLKKNAYVYETPLIAKDIPIDSLLLHLEREDTMNLLLNKYVYDITLTHANGDVDTFINNATFELVS